MTGSSDDMPPWLTPVDEIDDSQSGGLFAGNMKKVVIALAVIVIVVFSLAMWLMYDRPVDEFERPIEVIAESGPIKVKPADMGGKEILDQDKEVFKRITGEAEEKQPSALGEEAEIPLSELPDDEADQKKDKPTEDVEKAEAKSVEETKVDSKVRQKPEVARPAPKVLIAADKHKIQLGAYGEKSGATVFWNEIRTKMPNVLGGMQEEYVPLTRDGRTLYRLRAGPVENRAEADRICLQLKAKQYGCMVVDPK